MSRSELRLGKPARTVAKSRNSGEMSNHDIQGKVNAAFIRWRCISNFLEPPGGWQSLLHSSEGFSKLFWPRLLQKLCYQNKVSVYMFLELNHGKYPLVSTQTFKEISNGESYGQLSQVDSGTGIWWKGRGAPIWWMKIQSFNCFSP